MQNITVAGRIGADAVTRTTQGGDKVTGFNVAVDYREGKEKATNWYRVSFWGKRGESLQPYLLKGTTVAVSGEFQLDSYEGKPQLNIRASEISLLGSRPSNTGGGETSGRGGGAAPVFAGGDAGFDDDEIPFLRMDGVF
jgi:single-strand DNA-binding protein